MARAVHPTPAQWRWWRVTLANLAASFVEPREMVPAKVLAEVDNRDARMRACLRGERR